MVKNKAVYLALGIRADGRKEILGVVNRASRGCQILRQWRNEDLPNGALQEPVSKFI